MQNLMEINLVAFYIAPRRYIYSNLQYTLFLGLFVVSGEAKLILSDLG